MPSPREQEGYVVVDALVALAIASIAIMATIALASAVVTRLARADDRHQAARLAHDLYYQKLEASGGSDSAAGQHGGRAWRYVIGPASSGDTASTARTMTIEIERRHAAPLIVEAALPPDISAEATP